MSMRMPLYVTGTTCLAMTCSNGDGAVVAADSRMCQGEYILNDSTQKIFPLMENIVCLFSGSVRVNDQVLKELMRLVNEGNNAVFTPKFLASVALDCFHGFRYFGDSSHATICGWDSELGAIQIYYLDILDDDLGQPVESIAHGSGLTRAKTALNGHTPNITIENAKSRAVRGLCNASFFDLFTGGVMNVVHITKDACTPIYQQDSLTMYRENFSHHSNEHIIFLLCPHKTEAVNIRALGDLFSIFGHVIVPPHSVSMKKDFSFHRLILESAETVAMALEKLEELGALPEDGVEEINRFHLGLRMHDILDRVVYVVPATEENLVRIINMP